MSPVTESNELAQLIKLARGPQPMRELARRSGLSAAQISRIEAGSVESPTIETLTRLAGALDRDPQLLLAALGRIGGGDAVGLVQQALEQVAASAPDGLLDAGRLVQHTNQRVLQLDKRRVALLNEWQVLGGQHDVLKHESTELEADIDSLRSSEELNEDPETIESLREEADELEERLSIVLRDLDAVDRRGAALRQEMSESEGSLAEALERRSEIVRRTAGDLFVYGATSTNPIEELLENVVRMPTGSGKTQFLTRFLDSVTDPDAKRALAGVTARSAEIDVASERIQNELADLLEKSLARTRAELDQLTRQLRNQLVPQTGDTGLRKLAAAWNRLTPERRAKVLDFVEDQRRLSVQEQITGEEEEVLEPRSSRSGSKKGRQ